MISNTHLNHEFWQKKKRTTRVEVCCNITHFIT
jgi:hypothetical protein